MSFKMEFFSKMADQVRGLFQNQKSQSSSNPTTINEAITKTSSGMTRPHTSPLVTTSGVSSSTSSTVKLTNFYFNLDKPKLPSRSPIYQNVNSSSSNTRYNNLSPNEKYNQNHQSLGTSKSNHPYHQVLPPSTLSLSTWSSSASPGTPGTSSSGASTNVSQNMTVAMSPFNNNNHSNYTNVLSSHNQMHHQATNTHQVLHHYQQNHRSFDNQQHYHHNNNQSSSSSSTSFGGQQVPPLTPGGLGPRSYSAINTPDSPVNFRRQHSLNVNQRIQASSRLQLDLRSQKNSPLYQQQSASTDLIDKHSLSPRPRPKDLTLSNSQDNMLKQIDGHSSRFDGHRHQKLMLSNSRSQPRPGGLFDNTNNHHKQSHNGAKGGPGPGGSSTAASHTSIYYQNRIELSRNSSLLNIDGKKYDHLKENDFEERSQLGAGSFGQVDKMLHRLSNTELAVKKMRRSGNIDDNRHVQRDLELLQKCNYKHVVQCYGYFILETEVWIFMELMTTCFDHLIKKLSLINETVPENIIGKVAVATIDTLDYLKKEHNVIHRDIKPSNILINNQGIIKLCDFGISGSLINSKAHTRSVGSTAYMAPERIEPPPDGTYDIRSDIWSMGITLVEIATGQFPYKNWSTDFEILSKVIQEAPPTLPDDRNFSDNFKSFINACLIKNSNNRPKYKELMTYPFYQYYSQTFVDVAEWFKNAYCDTTSNSNHHTDHQMVNRSHSSSASSLASNSTIK